MTINGLEIISIVAPICFICIVALLVAGEIILSRIERKSDEARRVFGDNHRER